jgi:hypothetical protein
MGLEPGLLGEKNTRNQNSREAVHSMALTHAGSSIMAAD